jgi:hypothetical protein
MFYFKEATMIASVKPYADEPALGDGQPGAAAN